MTSGSTNRQIFGAAVTVALWTAVVKVAGVAKELVVALRFGTGDDIDAFLIALLVPSFLISVVAGSFNAALIPTYIRVREQEGKEAAQRLFSGVMVWSLGLLAIATFLMVVTAPFYLPLIARGFSPEKLDLTYRLLWIIAPVLMFSGIQVIWSAVLNAGERFALAALTPIITPTCSVILLLTCRAWGIFALAIGLVCGALLEMTLLGTALKRQNISLLPRWYGFEPHLRLVAGQYAPMIAGACLMISTSIVDQSMAAMLSPGSVATLSYSNKIVAVILSLSAGLWKAILPYFSKMVAMRDWLGLHHTLQRYILLIFASTIPITIFICISSKALVHFLFYRGAFTDEDTYTVSQSLSFYSLQIPFYIANLVLITLISSMQKSYLLMWAFALNLITNVFLNYVFIKWLGLAGIALSTSCVYFLSFSGILLLVTNNLKINLQKESV
nr:lipid II flippase MurJ [Coleofasciculus sp. FACHB-SPT36]